MTLLKAVGRSLLCVLVVATWLALFSFAADARAGEGADE